MFNDIVNDPWLLYMFLYQQLDLNHAVNSTTKI